MNEKIPFKTRESSLGEQERARSTARAGVEEILAAFPREEAQRSAEDVFLRRNRCNSARSRWKILARVLTD